MDDLISRQAAIDALACLDDYEEEAIEALRKLPSAQPDVPDTNVGDMVSRQAAIDALNGQISVTGDINAKAVQNYIRMVNQRLHDLPSAQPERKKAKWVHGKEIAREYLAGRITYIEYKDYHCSECGYTVENIRWNVDGELVDRYCTACGAQMEVEK